MDKDDNSGKPLFLFFSLNGHIYLETGLTTQIESYSKFMINHLLPSVIYHKTHNSDLMINQDLDQDRLVELKRLVNELGFSKEYR